MTDDHLDDKALSATIDGEPWPAHLASCPQCTERRRQLSDVAALVGAPVPAPPPGLENAAVTAALAAAGHRADTPRSWPRTLAVAAAIVAVLALSSAPLLFRGGSRPMVASPGADSAAGTSEADLGEVDDAAGLNARLRAALGLPAADVGGGVVADGPDSGNFAAPATAGDQSLTAEGGGPERAVAPIDQCLEDARRDFPAKAVLAYSARLRWQGQPAVVYVLIDDSKESLSRRAVVTSQADCSVLVVQSF